MIIPMFGPLRRSDGSGIGNMTIRRKKGNAMEYAWVIEHRRSQVSEPEYWAGNRWSKNHLDAIRFARQVDAERSRDGFDEDDPLPREQPHRVCEHGWGD